MSTVYYEADIQLAALVKKGYLVYSVGVGKISAHPHSKIVRTIEEAKLVRQSTDVCVFVPAHRELIGHGHVYMVLYRPTIAGKRRRSK